MGLVYDPKKPECSDLAQMSDFADAFFLKIQNATPEIIAALHATQKKVFVSEADDEQTARDQIAKGVDGILSNHPECIKILFQRVCQ
jgi:glycerophosphoryl diester phosphodiesterase